MMNWAKQQLANVAGTQEPIYGPSAIQSVAKQAETTPYTELTRADLAWVAMTSTCVETQSFYLMADSGHTGLAQVIYSNVAGIHTTCQFNTKIHYPAGSSKPNLWSSDQLSKVAFSADKTSFSAEGCSVELSAAGDSYRIRSSTNAQSVVDLTVVREAPGFQAGRDGKSYFGTDPAQPWGALRHAFWPACRAEGMVLTAAGPVGFRGRAVFVHALQGMKPHHAAARWNFAAFQGARHAAVMMEYTTPPSYGATVVNVGGLVRDGQIVCAGARNSATHLRTKDDPESEWREPVEASFRWAGETRGGEKVEAVLEGELGERNDRIDVMAEVPAFVKKIVAGAAGTKPYIYQYIPTEPMSLKVKIGDEEIVEEGKLFMEATFIS